MRKSSSLGVLCALTLGFAAVATSAMAAQGSGGSTGHGGGGGNTSGKGGGGQGQGGCGGNATSSAASGTGLLKDCERQFCHWLDPGAARACLIRVSSRHRVPSASCPICPSKRTFISALCTSALCQ